MKERILKKASADKTDTKTWETWSKNPYSRDNVNVPQGPRHGNEGAHKAKRGNFLDAKASREPIAEVIMNAFSSRAKELEMNPGEHEVPESGNIDSNSGIKRFTARKSKYAKRD